MADTQDYRQIPLGVPGRPYPMMQSATAVRGGSATTNLDERLDVLEDPLVFTSKRNYEDVMALAYRDMVTPSMLRTFYDGMERRREDSPSRIHAVFGPPGTGKSHMSRRIAEMRDERGAVVVDCGNMNLDELLFETVLDVENSKPTLQKLEERLRSGEMNPFNARRLKDALGDAYQEEDGKISIDWGKENADNAKSTKDIAKTLREVSELEGLSGGNQGDGLQIRTQYGPLIRAWQNGQEIVLDEFEKAKSGTDAHMQVVWQVMNGEVDNHTVRGGAGLSFTFNRNEMPPGFFVSLTGNTSEDGEASNAISQSLLDRLHPDYLEVPTERDVQHRLCQSIAGVPISTLHESFGHKMDDKKFSKMLHTFQTLGDNEVSPYQRWAADNWQRVDKATRQLATFYKRWGSMTNPDHEDFNPDLAMEVDEEYHRNVSVGMRRMMRHVRQASQSLPKVTSGDVSEGFDLSQDLSEAPEYGEPADPMQEFGANLARIVQEDIARTTKGKPNLRRLLQEEAANAGIVEATLQEGQKSEDMEALPDLLNMNQMEEKNFTRSESEQVQGAMFDYLKERDDSLQDKDQALPLTELHATLESLYEEKRELETGNRRDRVLVFPNPDYMEDSTGQETPFMLVPMMEGIGETEDSRGESPQEKWMEPKDFFDALSFPKVGNRNVESLFNEAVTVRDGGADIMGAPEADAQTLAENRHETGLAITTLSLGMTKRTNENGESEEVPEDLHLVTRDYGDRRETLITGRTELPQETKEKLAKNGVTYVARGEKGAAQKVNQALPKVFGSEKEMKANGDFVKEAFENRNSILPMSAEYLIEKQKKGEEITPQEIEENHGFDPSKSLEDNGYVFTESQYREKSLAEVLTHDGMPTFPVSFAPARSKESEEKMQAMRDKLAAYKQKKTQGPEKEKKAADGGENAGNEQAPAGQKKSGSKPQKSGQGSSSKQQAGSPPPVTKTLFNKTR